MMVSKYEEEVSPSNIIDIVSYIYRAVVFNNSFKCL